MKKNIFAVIAIVIAFVGFASCADDHFDVNPDVSSQQTLWHTIQADPNLSEFAGILQQVYVSKSQGVSTSQTYADLLDHDQVFTVWAPKNGNLDAYKKLLGFNDPDSTYRVEKELIQNQMVRYSHLLNRETADTLDLFNDKQTVFDQKNHTFGFQKISQWNLGCSNGVLHITDGASKYTHNLYEYLGTNPKLDSIYTFFKGFEKREFDENSSTQGPTIDGNITWVDSVTHVSNQIFYSIGAYLNREDSTYAMILPTNTAWDNALKQTKSYYNFITSYKQTVPLDEDNDTTIVTEFIQEEIDSMSNLYSKSAICSDLVFNAKYQYAPFDIDNPANCDSLISTTGTVFKQPYLTNIFAGASAPVRLSNGYGYITDNFGYRERDTWAKDKEVVAYMTNNQDKIEKCSVASGTSQWYRNDSVINFHYAKVVPQTSSIQPAVTFKLRNILSCKYDIYLVMAYNTNAMLPTIFKAELTHHDKDKGTTKTERLIAQPDDSLHDGGSKLFKNAPHLGTWINSVTGDTVYRAEYNDTILLAKDFKFDVCYQGLNYAYPTLKITTNIGSKDRNNYTKEMWIERIILVAKGNDDE